MYYEDLVEDWLTPDECAQRMGITLQRVMELVSSRVLKAQYDSGWIHVPPAILRGCTP
jgi:hypothetical protein